MFLPHHFISNKGKGIPLIVQFPRSAVVVEPQFAVPARMHTHGRRKNKEERRKRHMGVFI